MVICRKCNCGYDEKYGVCPNCGTPYQQYTENIAATSNKSKSGLIAVISISAVVLIGIFIALIMIFSQPNKQSQLNEQISLGEKYLTEENYEEAIVAFKKAIEIEPNDPELYIKLADAYVAKGDTANAISTLQEGYEKTQSERIKTKLDELTITESEVSTASEISAEEFSKDIGEEERTALENYAQNELTTSGNITAPYGMGEFIWKVNQYKVDDFNKDGSYELVVQYYVGKGIDNDRILGAYLSIFKYDNGFIKEYKTYDTLGDGIQLAGGDATTYGVAQELYVDSESNSLGILSLRHGNNLNQKYDYLYCEFNGNGFNKGIWLEHNEYGEILDPENISKSEYNLTYYGIKTNNYGKYCGTYSFKILYDAPVSVLDDGIISRDDVKRVSKDDYTKKLNAMKAKTKKIAAFEVRENYANEFDFDKVEFLSYEEISKRARMNNR